MVTGPQLSASDIKFKNLRLANRILAAAVVIALVFILFGLLQNRRLGLEKKQLQFQLQRMVHTQPCDSPRLGNIVPPIEADTSKGKRVTIHYDDPSMYLLFFLSFKCNECVKQLPNWNEIAKEATAKNVKVLGLTTDKEGINANTPDPAFDILTVYDAALLRAYRINVTPTIMLIAEHGRTRWVHAGSLNEASTQELLTIIRANTVGE
jgi:peroxiredoxin